MVYNDFSPVPAILTIISIETKVVATKEVGRYIDTHWLLNKTWASVGKR